MNVHIITVFALLGFCTATEYLTSRDLGNLIVKYARKELLYNEYKTIENVFGIYRRVWNSVRDIANVFQCFLCRSVFFALIFLIKIGVPDETIINTGAELCSISYTYKVCRGFFEQNLPILKYIIITTPEATPRTICGILQQNNKDPYSCNYYDPRFEWKIWLPPKVKFQAQPIYANSKPLTVAVLSDIHIDPLYEPFGVADCDEPVCCRKGQKPRVRENKYIDDIVLQKSVIQDDEEIILNTNAASKIIKTVPNLNIIKEKQSAPAGYWGDYRNCDTPIWAFIDVIKQIASHEDVDVVYYIGDNIDHHVWETTYELNEYVNSLVVDKMQKILRDDMLVVHTVGNHEAQPADQFAPTYVKGKLLNTTWLYESLANIWRSYLTEYAFNSMKKQGGYSMLIRPGLRVISINNIVAYKFNWWLVYDPHECKRQLEWLVEELYKAELAGEKVHILSHVPPGDQDLIYIWTREYHRIVDRFSSTITAQFNGHIHSDEFKIFYKDGKAFNVAWSAGSATTFQNFNLNYKIVTFDNNNFEPTSMVNYIYNLTEANLNPNQPPRWYKLYDMQTSFQLRNLSVASMDQLVSRMVTNKKYLLDQYVDFASKDSDAMPHCDTSCKLDMLCNAVTTVLWDRTKCYELMKLYFVS
ncbi:sphingomyelin phosphodiesterase 1-like [Maniola jurtina]|uniref:sphingomyelin phosphodiesterase 1-like n=1 Tax=Maniola jurtina TaxID=191418 RepID=UPI001E68E02A|nr:sphingomyelin phosphodiesterase 1-like [Maniola jurtina]